jgi:hypothetical protein
VRCSGGEHEQAYGRAHLPFDLRLRSTFAGFATLYRAAALVSSNSNRFQVALPITA